MGIEEMEEIIERLTKENERMRSSLEKIAYSVSNKGLKEIENRERTIMSRRDVYPYAVGMCWSESMLGLFGESYLLATSEEREQLMLLVEKKESEGLHEEKEETKRDTN